MISFTHASDLHLNKNLTYSKLPNFVVREVKENKWLEFEKFLKFSREKDVDFVLITGDTFERDSIDLYTENKTRDLFNKYQDLKIFMIFGNHDYYDEKISAFVNSFPKNVYVFKNSSINFYELKNIGTRIYGISWTSQFSSNKKFDPDLDRDFYNILLFHEDLENNDGFYNKNEISNFPFDYVGLGHIHKNYTYKNIYNPGSLSPSSFKDLGPSGFNYVQIDRTIKNTFIEQKSPRFIELDYDISEVSQDDFIDYFDRLDKNNYYRVNLSGYSKLTKKELESLFSYIREKFFYIEFIDKSYFWDIEKLNIIKKNLLFREILKNIEESPNKDDLLEVFLEKIGETFEDF